MTVVMRPFASSVRSSVMALTIALFVTACGGGGGDSAGTAPQTGGPPPASSGNNAPTISGTPMMALRVGEPYSFKPTAADSDGDSLTFSVTNKPAWMALNQSTGELSGTPGASDVGSFKGLAMSVTDGKASASLAVFNVSVTQVSNGSAVLNWGAPTQNTDGTALTSLSGYRVLYGRSSTDLSQAVSIGNPSVNSTVVENLSPGTWYFAVVSIGAAGVESTVSNVVSTTI